MNAVIEQSGKADQADPSQERSKQANGQDVEFSLARFELLTASRQREEAAREMMRLLNMLNRNYGALDGGFRANLTADLSGGDQDPHIINRICCALTMLFSDPEFNLSVDGTKQLFFLHRWMATLFAASTFRNADHILRVLNLNGPEAVHVQLKHEDLVKFSILYTPNSEIPLDMDAMWSVSKNLAASLACALLSPRFLGTPSAHRKREVLLPWLASRLDEIEDLDVLPVGILHDVYMHCSYADRADKHAIKAPINRLVRKKLLQQGINDVDFQSKPCRQGGSQKPVMLVILEWFSGAHSIYRTHSASLRAAREQFRVIGIGNPDNVDELGRGVFDEFIEAQSDMVRVVRNEAQRLLPDMVYYPAFGMFPTSIYLANLRLAPVQVISYGHPATSNSPFVDYFVLPEDWVGEEACFSEKLIALPKEAMPFVPSAASVEFKPTLREAPQTLHIAVAATTMKLNPAFLRTLARIQKAAPRPVQFHFFMGFSRGLVYLEVRQFIRSWLPDAAIHTHMPYSQYMAGLNECDMCVNPFPFGNTNGIVDVATLGLVGVCKTGPEVLEHIDEALFRRLGLPEWLIASTEDEYVDSALRLISDDQTRLSLRRKLIDGNAVATLYEGEPEEFGHALAALCK